MQSFKKNLLTQCKVFKKNLCVIKIKFEMIYRNKPYRSPLLLVKPILTNQVFQLSEVTISLEISFEMKVHKLIFNLNSSMKTF